MKPSEFLHKMAARANRLEKRLAKVKQEEEAKILELYRKSVSI